jgi:hypothetical protein
MFQKQIQLNGSNQALICLCNKTAFAVSHFNEPRCLTGGWNRTRGGKTAKLRLCGSERKMRRDSDAYSADNGARHSRSRMNQPLLAQVLDHGFGAGLDVKLFVNRVQVRAHGAESNSELIGNFLVEITLRKQA